MNTKSDSALNSNLARRLITTLRNVLILLSLALGASWIVGWYYLKAPTLSGPGESADLGDTAIEASVLRAHVEALAGLNPPRNYAHKASLNAAASYIESTWKSAEVASERQSFKTHDGEYHNIIARFGNAQGPLIVIGAHYDVAGQQPGADDNASGVAGLIELGRALQKLSAHPKLAEGQIELVAYSLEEPPYFGGDEMGSAFHARKLRDEGRVPRFMISLEMIGYFTDEANSQEFPIPLLSAFYPTRGNFIGVVGVQKDRKLIAQLRDHMRLKMRLDVEGVAAPSFLPGIDFSDHRNYWQMDWPAVMITNTAFHRNKEYHQVGDTPDRLDYQKMAEVTRGVLGAALSML
ncbi:MAG TPA: M28 family peptidase [Pseudobdellovibrionaceae bacterium]|nr:M28 family peptidase [Pseudobdellovibrionaceae bacterium]